MPSSVYLHDGEKQITVRFPTEEDRERFKAHYRALDALAVQFRAERDKLRGEVDALEEQLQALLETHRQERLRNMADWKELRRENDDLRGEVATLRDGHQWILDAANAVQEGKTSEAVALIAIEDFANYSLAAVPADARGEDSQNDSQNSAR